MDLANVRFQEWPFRTEYFLMALKVLDITSDFANVAVNQIDKPVYSIAAKRAAPDHQ
jgi:hypothetical protein